MRLIQTSHPIGLREFFDNEVSNLKYAILSHRWETEEVTFQEMMDLTEKIQQKRGYQKVARFCERARADGFEYVWVDTCCINKESSAELSESINSMFRWYLESAKCYAYMSDVNSREELASSVWFTRGWTLQELVAPREMVFLDKNWEEFGSRQDLCHEIEEVTKIDASLLLGESRLEHFSVAKRMSWAAVRETTRSEDRAYCLMGIFNVNMPLLYGEGDNAFLRLQEEIMKNSNDESLFAWESDGVSSKNPRGLLARSPKEFANSGHIFPVSISQDATPFSATNRGIQLQSPLLPPREEISTLVLQCSAGSGLIGIGIISKPGAANGDEDFVRRKGSLDRDIPHDMLLGSALDTVYIPKSFVGAPTDDKAGLDDENNDTASKNDAEKPGGTLHSRIQPRGHHKKLIICFDDTKHEFTGDGSDSLVSKIHRMFEREENDQVCFYRSWTSDTTFEDLVISAYKFLMEHYGRSDMISIFGYSKGGYAARYLAHLLDYVGILVNGHEHMIPKVWQMFRDYLASPSENEGDKELRKHQFQYMKSFRDAFVRPTGGTHFIGLLDAVDIPSVKNLDKGSTGPMSKILRHAISVDERQVSLQPLLVTMPERSDGHPERFKSKLDDENDVQEVWFPGCHKDLGSEMKLEENETWAISHLPLVWMVTEARKAGLRFDLRKQANFQCGNIYSQINQLNKGSLDPDDLKRLDAGKRDFTHALVTATKGGVIHDELTFGKGWSFTHVCKRKLKNAVASKRSDVLAKDNYRHIPPGAWIHASVLRRMQADQTYKPLNVRISDSSAVVNKDDPIGKCIIQGDETGQTA